MLAARPSTPPRDYVCTTGEENRAWLDGFMGARMADG